MRTTLFGFGVVYLIGALLLVFDVAPISPLKNLSVIAFLLPGVVALVAHIEIAKLKKQLDDIRERERQTSSKGD